MTFYVYMLASRKNGTLYIGLTDNLSNRIEQHRNGMVPGFTRTHGVKTLVWFEGHESRESAFARERSMKRWKRAWKVQLIEDANPDWKDLSSRIPH